MRANANGPICCFCKYVIKLCVNWVKRSDICIVDQRCKNRHHFRKHEIVENKTKNIIRNLKTLLFEKIRFRKCNRIRSHLLETLNICFNSGQALGDSGKENLPFNRSKYRRHTVIYKNIRWWAHQPKHDIPHIYSPRLQKEAKCGATQ